MSRLLHPRHVLLAALALALPFTSPITAQAAPVAKQQTQVPGFYRMAVGDLEVTALYDGYVAAWDAKFEYDHWRPSTAIAAAGGGAPGGAWEPMRPPPPFPEYPSAHATGCAAAFTVLRRTLGDGPLAMDTVTAPAEMPRRSFPDLDAAARECADSRVRLGWHFRYATDAGLELGRQVAEWVVGNSLRPR